MANKVRSVVCGASGLLWVGKETCTFKRFQTWIRQIKEVKWYEQVFEKAAESLVMLMLPTKALGLMTKSR
jgi:hypothetical protein